MMAISVVMPALEMAQETGKLLAWRKKEGESVRKGEPLLEVETDKAVVEVEAPGDGMLAGITADVGAVIPVGETIAWLLAPGEKPPVKVARAAPAARASSGVARQTAGGAQVAAVVKTAVANRPPQISPKARRLAKELGVDFALVHGTGPDQVITAEDVQWFADSKAAVPDSMAPAATGEFERPSQVARLMAERTTQSWTSVPHFFLVREVDASGLLDAQKGLRDRAEEPQSTVRTITDLLIALVARTLAKHPRVNASWTGEGIRSNPDINVSVAVAVKDGVVAVVVHKADTLEIEEISTARRALMERARAGRLRPADITGGTFTLSNLGMYRVDAFNAIITVPQAAVLAVGAISERVVAVEGRPGVRPMMTMTLSSDHRVMDGATAAEFLSDLAEAIREPMKVL
jgi:pyruvate dehydrogenase E2 component (dihydrolipoamide acetyltransferase)